MTIQPITSSTTAAAAENQRVSEAKEAQNIRPAYVQKIEENKGAPKYDRYEPGQPEQSIGLYKMGQDEEGNPKLEFDAPKAPENAAPEQKKEEQCITNTDRVDREIEALKKQGEQLEKQLKTEQDPQKAKRLKQMLTQVQQELGMKDNDSYRKQNAQVTYKN